jgi:hypothetical protein
MGPNLLSTTPASRQEKSGHNERFREESVKSKENCGKSRPGASKFTRDHLTKLMQRLHLQRQPPAALAA